MGSAIERALRNAKDINVAPADADGSELRVWTSLTGSLACQGFQIGGGQATIATSPGLLPAVTDWADWQDGIVQHGSEPYFVRVGDTVTYTFDITTESAPVPFSGRAKMRSTATGETAPCW